MNNEVKVSYELNGVSQYREGDLAYIAVGKHLEEGGVQVMGVMHGHLCDPAIMGIIEGLQQAVGGWAIIRCVVRKAIKRLFGLEEQA